MLTVTCVLCAGPVRGYDVNYVVRLERMVRRHLRRPFRFVCLTDGTRGTLPASIETLHIPAIDTCVPEPTRGIWQKVQLFNPDHGFVGRMLYLDLDVLVVGALDAIVDVPVRLALTKDALVVERAHLDRDRYGRRVVRCFNSSVMVWDAWYGDLIFDQWSPQLSLKFSTDQDWLGEIEPDAFGLPLEWFPRISRVEPPWPAEAKVVLVKKPKPHEAVERWPWFEAEWGGWAA